MPTILLLGGYGNLGRQIARHLLAETRVDELYIAGRNVRRARETAQDLRCEFPGRRIGGLEVDVRNLPLLTEAFFRADCIVNAASTVDHTENIVRALLDTGRDYLDTQLSLPPKLAVLERYAGRLAEAGVCCITDGGFHPGLPAVLVRYAARRFHQLHEARVYTAMNLDWKALQFSEATRRELADEFRFFRPLEFRRGRWRSRSWLRPLFFRFDPPFGRRYCAPMYLSELKTLPEELPKLEKLGLYISGFNPVLDYLLLPFISLGLFLLPRRRQGPVGRLLEWGLRFSRPPYGVEMTVVARGRKYQQEEELTLRLTHSDPYTLTAISVVACLQQWLRGEIRQPGLHRQARIVQPAQLLADMRQMGLEERTEWGRSQAAARVDVGRARR